jgi:hypothetical protein
MGYSQNKDTTTKTNNHTIIVYHEHGGYEKKTAKTVQEALIIFLEYVNILDKANVFVLNNERRIIKAHLRKGNRYTVMEEHL